MALRDLLGVAGKVEGSRPVGDLIAPWRRSSNRHLSIEPLEGRHLLSVGVFGGLHDASGPWDLSLQESAIEPTPHEQYLLELINRGRADPTAEASRYGLDLNDGLTPGTISPLPKQPLAFSPPLIAAARGHSQWMLDTNTFSHDGAGGAGPGDRMEAAGYEFTSPWRWGENIAWKGTTGTVVATAFVEEIHESLYESPDHRKNLMNDQFREVGAGVVEGWFTTSGKTYKALMVTECFAAAGHNQFLTGVVYDDRLVLGDDFYTPGEGLGGVVVEAVRESDGEMFSTVTWASGGYTLRLPSGTYTVTASGGGLGGSVTREGVSIAEQNVKLDFTPPDPSTQLGADIHLTLTLDPTSTNLQGTVETPPTSPAWIDGWTRYYTEIWVRTTHGGANGGVMAAAAQLNYNPQHFTAVDVAYGAGFIGGEVVFEHQAGRIVEIIGATTEGGVGENEYALLARVAFEPTGDDHTPMVFAPDHVFAGPYDLGLALEAVEVTLGHGPGNPVIAPPPETELWSMIYHHFSAEPRIGVPELLAVVRAFNEPITPESPPEHRWADFDRSGHVGVPDLLAIVRNFGLERPTNAITYPSNFPAAWRLEEAGDEGKVLAGFAATEAELSAGGTLSRSAGASSALAVNEYSREETAGVGAVAALAAPGTMTEEPADGRNGAAAERTGWYLAERYTQERPPGPSRDIGPQPPEALADGTSNGRAALLEAALVEVLASSQHHSREKGIALPARTWLLDAASERTSLVHDAPLAGPAVDSALESLLEEDAIAGRR